MSKRLFVTVAVMAAVGAMIMPVTASAEDYDPYVALFAGWAMPFKTDFTTSGAGISNFTTYDVDLNSSLSWGGKAGVWTNQTRDLIGLDMALELDVTNYYPSQPGGRTYRATGTFAGGAITSTTTQQFNFQSTLVALNILARLPLLDSQEFPDGRLFPYAGGGAGFDRLDYKSTDSSGDAMDLAYQAKGGVEFYITRGISAFVEAKYTMTSHTIKDSGGNDAKYSFNVLHAVGGLALHF